MTDSLALLVIKPMTVGRGEAPEILEKILRDCSVDLCLFRQWPICSMTLQGLEQVTNGCESDWRPDQERLGMSWICLFRGTDQQYSATSNLDYYCGPKDPTQWMPRDLRYRYGGYTRIGKTAHPSDTVVHITNPLRLDYEANLLFMDFDINKI